MIKIFFKEFLKNTKQIGAITPSSQFLSKAMVSKIDYKFANVIIELGAGTGVFTKMLINNLNPNTKLFVFEINLSLYKKLYDEYSHTNNVFIIHASAESLKRTLDFYGINNADYIVSGLPFLNFPSTLRNTIFNNIYDLLNPKGKIILFQYTKFLEKEFDSFFKIKKREIVYLNFPPAYVYLLQKSN